MDASTKRRQQPHGPGCFTRLPACHLAISHREIFPGTPRPFRAAQSSEQRLASFGPTSMTAAQRQPVCERSVLGNGPAEELYIRTAPLRFTSSGATTIPTTAPSTAVVTKSFFTPMRSGSSVPHGPLRRAACHLIMPVTPRKFWRGGPGRLLASGRTGNHQQRRVAGGREHRQPRAQPSDVYEARRAVAWRGWRAQCRIRRGQYRPVSSTA